MQAITQEYEDAGDVIEHDEPSVDEAPQQHETPNEGVEVPGEEQPTNEERARAMGWRPKEEYNGNPEHWRDADEFIAKGEEQLPILRENNKRLSDQVAKANRRDQERDAEIAQMRRMSEIALVRQREQLSSQFHAAKREAVETGDTERYDQLAHQEHQALGQFDDQVREVVQSPQAQAPQQNVYEAPETQDFISRNPWFETNRAMHDRAVMESQRIGNLNPDWSLGDVLKETERQIRTVFPDKFGGGQQQNTRPATPAVEGGGGRGAATRQTGRGSASLPQDARKQGQAFVDEGLYKNLEEYAKDYFAEGQ